MLENRGDRAIYLLEDSGDLKEVRMQGYKTEDILQSLIEKHPELLAGEQINREGPSPVDTGEA